MDSKKCGRCDRNIAVNRNTDPDGLCGYCQNLVGKPGSKSRQAWVEAGRLRVAGETPSPRSGARTRVSEAERRMIQNMPLNLLILCERELRRREEEARKLISALKEARS